ncbi:MAG: hypothetical protein HC890_12725 [Chloroflexaceae bacterium]|nr:hypothetical protein [Chloroflexaceae bacterium]
MATFCQPEPIFSPFSHNEEAWQSGSLGLRPGTHRMGLAHGDRLQKFGPSG